MGMLSILEFHRDAHDYRKAQADRDWIRKEPNIAAEKTVAIMGLGAIGSHVAAKVAMLGFRTIGWSRTPKTCPVSPAIQAKTASNLPCRS